MKTIFLFLSFFIVIGATAQSFEQIIQGRNIPLLGTEKAKASATVQPNDQIIQGRKLPLFWTEKAKASGEVKYVTSTGSSIEELSPKTFTAANNIDPGEFKMVDMEIKVENGVYKSTLVYLRNNVYNLPVKKITKEQLMHERQNHIAWSKIWEHYNDVRFVTVSGQNLFECSDKMDQKIQIKSAIIDYETVRINNRIYYTVVVLRQYYTK